jgi:hypothetical protein
MNEENPILAWSHQEDSALTSTIQTYGARKWKKVIFKIQERYPDFQKSVKECRDRWNNFLSPDMLQFKWSPQEIDSVFEGHKKYGTRWSMIGKMVKGRTDNAIKNLFYCRMRKMIRRIGKQVIDDETYCSIDEFRHSMYILWNLKRCYILPLASRTSIPGDQYIVRIINKYGISANSYNKYLNKLLSVIPEFYKEVALKEYSEAFDVKRSDTPTTASDQVDMILPAFKDAGHLFGKRIEPEDGDLKLILSFEPYMYRLKSAFIPLS